MTNDYKQIVINTIANTLGVEESEIAHGAHFMLDLNATPDELQQIKSDLEEKMDISLPEFTEESPATVAELLELVDDSTL